MRLASQIIDSLSGDWDPKRYHDTYTEELRELLERKAKGEVVEEDPTPDQEPAKVLDLMEALQASLDKAKKPGASRAKKAPAKKAPAKKAAAKKAPARKSTASKSPASKSA
jgi:DNA end-binding protein Ku